MPILVAPLKEGRDISYGPIPDGHVGFIFQSNRARWQFSVSSRFKWGLYTGVCDLDWPFPDQPEPERITLAF